MKTQRVLKTVPVIFLTLILAGCGSFWRGAGVGAAAGAVGYGAYDAVTAKRQLDMLDDDYKKGKITTQEYEIRKDQIKKGSIFY